MKEINRILIVEEDESPRVFLTRVLEKQGYEVLTAEDGIRALEILGSEDVRLIITDWIMPRMGGVELCHAIRQRNTQGHVFIIMVTAKDLKTDIIEAIDAGADDYVTKPYDEGELMARIRAGARVVQLEQELSEKNRDLSEANDRMNKDLMAAGLLQKSFLPKSAPDVPGLRFSWFFRPCELVGGDTFNCFAVNDEYVALYMLDVSGHGVSAAILSVMLSRILTPYAKRGGILCREEEGLYKKEIRPPRELAQILNNRFPMDDDVGQYFTILYAVIHVPTLTMKMVKAGHPYLAVLRHKGDVEFSRKAGLPIGMFEGAVFNEEAMKLNPGDRVFMYSDGIVEAANRQGEFYRFDRFAEVLKANRMRDISEIKDRILEDVLNFIGNATVKDDMTLIGVSCDG